MIMIVCAAIKLQNGTVIPCVRHGNGYKMIKDLNLPREICKSAIEGFITNRNTFLDRKKAFQYAKSIGQLSISTIQFKTERKEDELYSEDLY